MISKGDIDGLAELSRLQLTDAEKDGLQKDVSNILEYVGQLAQHSLGEVGVSAVGVEKTEDLKPLLRNVMREDTPNGEKGVMVLGSREMLIEALPKKEKGPLGGFFNVVRKIIQKDE